MAVGDLLAETDLALRPVHVSNSTFDVRWVATSELPDPAPFFQGGEVLLTTGLQTADWTVEWQRYADSLVDVGVVALGMGTGLTYAHMPTELIDACRQAGLNLFEVPRRTPFVAISHRISRLLADQEEAGARQTLVIQRKLTAAAAKADPIRAVILVVADALQGAVVIATPDGRVELGPVGKRRHDLVLGDYAAELHRLRQRTTAAAGTVSDSTATVVLQPIGSGRRASVLIALGPPKLTEAQRNSITTAVALLSLIAEQRHHSAVAYRRLRRRAVELLVVDDPQTAELVLGAEPTAPVLPNPMRVVRASGSRRVIDDVVGALEARWIVVPQSNSEVVAIASRKDAADIADHLATAGMRVGIGSAVEPSVASQSYRAAGIALAQATSANAIVGWEQIVRQGPLGLIDAATAQRFASSFLGALDGEQVDTLRCFLRHHGSRLKVAEELKLHRNTVRNRIDAIGALLPGTLDDPQVRASAWIALQASTP